MMVCFTAEAMRIQRKKQINKMLRKKLQDSVPVWMCGKKQQMQIPGF